MSLIVSSFFDEVYNSLSSSIELRENIHKVYLTTPQKPTYPFSVLELNEVFLLNNLNYNSYNVNFDVWVFYRNQSAQVGLKIADKIDQCLHNISKVQLDYWIIGTKQQKITAIKSEDMLTTKLSIQYLSLIKQR